MGSLDNLLHAHDEILRAHYLMGERRFLQCCAIRHSWLHVRPADVPMWRKDGGAVIYTNDDGYVIESAVTARHSELSVGATRILFRGNPEMVPQAGQTFAIAPDGRFLIDTRRQENQSQIVVISNWDAGLKK